MIGAMPAIAVRGKGKTDGSIGFMSRPHKLSLHFRPPLTHQVTPTPSPVNSPTDAYIPSSERQRHKLARNFLSKRCIFQLSVLAPLVGAIILFIGLIQLTPGAEANPYSVPLISAGCATLVLGIFVILLRFYFSWELNRLNQRREVPQIKVNEPSVTDPDVEKIGQPEGKPVGNNFTGDTHRKSSVSTAIMIPTKNKSSASPTPSPNLNPSPKAPPRTKPKDKDKNKEESLRLLQAEESDNDKSPSHKKVGFEVEKKV